MTDYQTLTLKETHEKLIASTTEYPLTLGGIFYIKFIEYEETFDINENTKIGEWIYKPIKFVTLLPDMILKRENIWSQEEEDMIIEAAMIARDRENTMVEYREAAEKEMEKRAKEIPPQKIQIDEDDEIIDSDFNTKINPLDPNYG